MHLGPSMLVREEADDAFLEDTEGLESFRFLGVPIDFKLTPHDQDVLLFETTKSVNESVCTWFALLNFVFPGQYLKGTK